MITPPEGTDGSAALLAYLRSPLAIRARCENVLEAGLAGVLSHFAVDLDALPRVADRVAAVTRANYPTLVIPVHGRLNHLRAVGIDFERDLATIGDDDERRRSLFEHVMVSVLLDAGAGPSWRYLLPAGGALHGSEGLAYAVNGGFVAGAFSSSGAATAGAPPLRVDAAGLEALTAPRLAAIFQSSDDNPLAGLTGRLELLHRLAAALRARPDLFPGARPGGLVDVLRARGAVSATDLLRMLLDGLSTIWPGRLNLGGANLGDTWRHPHAGGSGSSQHLVPFHKLSQWLAYSLFEPLDRAGVRVKEPGALTGLGEYRNGGLFVDLGALVPRHDAVLGAIHRPGDEVIVEWRALTVALLDRVADLVRARLGKTADELPLACILEGGTWAAGRVVAAELRAGGGPPIRIESDGTVF